MLTALPLITYDKVHFSSEARCVRTLDQDKTVLGQITCISTKCQKCETVELTLLTTISTDLFAISVPDWCSIHTILIPTLSVAEGRLDNE